VIHRRQIAERFICKFPFSSRRGEKIQDLMEADSEWKIRLLPLGQAPSTTQLDGRGEKIQDLMEADSE
jgi:hypothetical protein